MNAKAKPFLALALLALAALSPACESEGYSEVLDVDAAAQQAQQQQAKLDATRK